MVEGLKLAAQTFKKDAKLLGKQAWDRLTLVRGHHDLASG